MLVAIEPQMYREVLVLHFRQQRPRSEVALACPQTLQVEAKRVSPHLIVANELAVVDKAEEELAHGS